MCSISAVTVCVWNFLAKGNYERAAGKMLVKLTPTDVFYFEFYRVLLNTKGYILIWNCEGISDKLFVFVCVLF